MSRPVRKPSGTVPEEMYRRVEMELPGYRDSVRALEPVYGKMSPERRKEFLDLLQAVSSLDLSEVKLQYFEQGVQVERQRLDEHIAQLGKMTVDGIDPVVLSLLSPSYQEMVANIITQHGAEPTVE